MVSQSRVQSRHENGSGSQLQYTPNTHQWAKTACVCVCVHASCPFVQSLCCSSTRLLLSPQWGGQSLKGQQSKWKGPSPYLTISHDASTHASECPLPSAKKKTHARQKLTSALPSYVHWFQLQCQYLNIWVDKVNPEQPLKEKMKAGRQTDI